VSSVGLVLRDGAKEALRPYWLDTMTRFSRSAGFPTPSGVTYNMQAARAGALFVGNPEQVAQKIRPDPEQMRHDRHIFQFDFSSVPQAQGPRVDRAPGRRGDAAGAAGARAA
jgi:hypothetical protein